MNNKKDKKVKKSRKSEKKVKRTKEKEENNVRFIIVELDTLRGPYGSNFKTMVEAKDINHAIDIFYRRFPGSSNHLIVVPEEYVFEHIGYVQPKIAIKIDKNVPLIT